MGKRLKKYILCFAVLLSVAVFNLFQVDAVNVNKKCSLTLNECISGLNVHLYRVARVLDDGSYHYTDAFKEAEYVAPEIDGTNVALDGRADANGFNDVYRAPNIIDGSRLTYWEGSQNEESQIISVDLKDSYTIHTVVVGLNPAQIWGKRTQTFKIEASDDGQNYTEVIPSTDYDFDPKTGNQVVIDIDNVKMQYIRLTFTKNTGAVAGQIAELEVYTNDK